MNLISLVLCMAMFIIGCQSEPYIDTFDTISWKSDANGCGGERLSQLALLMDGQQQLMGWSESKITDYLGSPDYLELFVRNQKFLIYYLEPALECRKDGKENPLRLYIRMDALGDSRELSLKNK
jgi:hypothetical protein